MRKVGSFEIVHSGEKGIGLKSKTQLVAIVQLERENYMICWSMQNPQSTTRHRVKGHLVNDVFIKDVPNLLRKE